jgi:sortase A
LSKKHTLYGSRAGNVLLPSVVLALPPAVFVLFFALLALGYVSTPATQAEAQRKVEGGVLVAASASEPAPASAETTVEAVRPEDILSEEDRTGAPKFRDWYEEGSDEPVQLNTGTSAGAIPAVKPFNFGRDPGGPEDKTLYLTVPKLGISEVPVFDSVSEEKLKEGTIHVPATGFPWQGGANVYIAGHRLGYPDTRSLYVFYDLDKLVAGDEIFVKDSAGGEYVYKVTEQKVVPPDNVEVMNAVEDKSLITLQTCTLPDFAERIAVQGELVQKSA